MGEQQYAQIDKSKLEQAIDYKDICDLFLSVLATAENIVSLTIDEKQYGYYDEYNSKKYKTHNGLMLQFLRLLKIMKENLDDYDKEYDKPFQFPKKINFEKVKKQIAKFKSLYKDKYFHLYLDEIINIANGNPKLDLEKYKGLYYSNRLVTDDQKINRLNNIVSVKVDSSKEEEKVREQIEKTGKFNYEPVFGALPGRYEESRQKTNIRFRNDDDDDCDLSFE